MIDRSQRSEGSTTELSLRIRIPKRWPLVLAALVVLIIAVFGLLWMHIGRIAANDPDPLTPSVLAAMKFPLYYPTTLPAGYQVDSRSVTTPKAGVVVLYFTGPSGNRIWLSEEARPTEFNLGGFYDNLQHLSEFGVSDGTVAFGYDGVTEIASRANNTTWLLSNTNAKVPEAQMVAMLKSIVPAH